MIYDILQTICDALDGSLKNQFNSSEHLVVLNLLKAIDETIAPQNTNKIVISVWNFGRSSVIKNTEGSGIQLNILVSSNFDDYGQSLKMLDAVFLFIENNPMLKPIPIPGRQPHVETFQMIEKQLTIDEVNRVRIASGAGFTPFIMCEIRAVISSAT